jgi:hypothetical protein
MVTYLWLPGVHAAERNCSQAASGSRGFLYFAVVAETSTEKNTSKPREVFSSSCSQRLLREMIGYGNVYAAPTKPSTCLQLIPGFMAPAVTVCRRLLTFYVRTHLHRRPTAAVTGDRADVLRY